MFQNKMESEVRLKKKVCAKENNTIFFQDEYGVLKLAADVNKSPNFIRRFFINVKQLWINNSISFSDFMWIEPSDFMHELYWLARNQKEE